MPGMSIAPLILSPEVIHEFSPRLTQREKLGAPARKFFHKAAGKDAVYCFKHLHNHDLEKMSHPAVQHPDHWTSTDWRPRTSRQPKPPAPSPSIPAIPQTARGRRLSPRVQTAPALKARKTARMFGPPDTRNPRSCFYQGGAPLLRPRGGNNLTSYNGYAEIRRKIGQSEHRLKQTCGGKSAFRYMEPTAQSVDTVKSDWLDLECHEVEQLIAESEHIKDANLLQAQEQWDLSKIDDDHKSRRRAKGDNSKEPKERSQIRTPDLLDAFFKSQLIMSDREALRALSQPKFKRQLLKNSSAAVSSAAAQHFVAVDNFERAHNEVISTLQKRLIGQERGRFAASATRLHALSAHLDAHGCNDGGAEKALNMVNSKRAAPVSIALV